jgi:hypothetical protein
MESFRVLEKELKQNKLNKEHFLNRKEKEGKFVESGDEDSDNYGGEDNDSDSSYRNNYDDEPDKS